MLPMIRIILLRRPKEQSLHIIKKKCFLPVIAKVSMASLRGINKPLQKSQTRHHVFELMINGILFSLGVDDYV
jgi:hypothetical protein